MKMSSENGSNQQPNQQQAQQDAADRRNASHGEFFFARFALPGGNVRKSPVFVISNDGDKRDVVVLKCTGQPAKSDYDIEVQLAKETRVRTNKVYTVGRSQLLFKIPQTASPKEYSDIITMFKQAMKI